MKVTQPQISFFLKSVFFQQYADKPGLPVPRIVKQDVLPDCIVVESSGAVNNSNNSNNNSNNTNNSDPVVIVGALCGCAVLRGADVFAPGVMGAPPALGVGERVEVRADVEGRCLKGSDSRKFKGLIIIIQGLK